MKAVFLSLSLLCLLSVALAQCRVDKCEECVSSTQTDPATCEQLTYAETVERDCENSCATCAYDNAEQECDWTSSPTITTCTNNCIAAAPPAPTPTGSTTQCRVNSCNECVDGTFTDPANCGQSSNEAIEKACENQCSTCTYDSLEQECGHTPNSGYASCYNSCVSNTPIPDYCDTRGCNFDQCTLVTSSTPPEECQPPTTPDGICNEECKDHRICNGNSNCAFTEPNASFTNCKNQCLNNPPAPEPCIVTGCKYETCQAYDTPYDDSACTEPTTKEDICRKQCRGELDCDQHTVGAACTFADPNRDYTSCYNTCFSSTPTPTPTPTSSAPTSSGPTPTPPTPTPAPTSSSPNPTPNPSSPTTTTPTPTSSGSTPTPTSSAPTTTAPTPTTAPTTSPTTSTPTPTTAPTTAPTTTTPTPTTAPTTAPTTTTPTPTPTDSTANSQSAASSTLVSKVLFLVGVTLVVVLSF